MGKGRGLENNYLYKDANFMTSGKFRRKVQGRRKGDQEGQWRDPVIKQLRVVTRGETPEVSPAKKNLEDLGLGERKRPRRCGL